MENKYCRNFSLSFINVSSNYCLSNLESHFKSMMHLTAVEKEEQEQVEKLGGNQRQDKNYYSKQCIDQEYWKYELYRRRQTRYVEKTDQSLNYLGVNG